MADQPYLVNIYLIMHNKCCSDIAHNSVNRFNNEQRAHNSVNRSNNEQRAHNSVNRSNNEQRTRTN